MAAVKADPASSGMTRNRAAVSRGATIAEAKARAYTAVAAIDFPGGFYRTDIGSRAVS